MAETSDTISTSKNRLTGWMLALLPFGATVYWASLTNAVAAGQTLSVSWPWVPSLGVNLSFYIDGLSLLFALLISGIGALIVIYAGGYLAGHPQLARFYFYILLFMAAMLGLVLCGNLIILFIFWELTSISSYLLIGFDHQRERARKAALQALIVTGAGGLALMAGFILLGHVGGSFELAALLDQGELVRGHGLYFPILLLILAGAFTKSAQMPFHFWLPNAMEAPAPVSAYLHSATMVKAGIYLLARFSPILGGAEAWHYLVTAFGAATMLLGALLAFPQTDLKRILAYTTVSALGTLTLLLGLNTTLATKAAMVFLLVHSLYKGALFMIAGAVDHETGTRDVKLLGNLRRFMPMTTMAASLAALSMAGVPPLSGFWAKFTLIKAGLETGQYAIVAIALVVSLLTVFSMTKIWAEAFWKKAPEAALHNVGASASYRVLLLPIVALAGITVLIGIVAEPMFALATRAAEQLLHPAEYIQTVLD
jgi:multicomponent Na+:H+ antiporter subunit A